MDALSAGQKSVEHLDGYLNEVEADDSPFRGRFSWQKLYFAVKVDDEKIRRAAEATRRAGAWNVPTLIVRRKVAPAETVKNWLKSPEMKYIPREAAEFWEQSNSRTIARMSPGDFVTMESGKSISGKIVKSLDNAGARLLIGTDTPNPFVVPGFSVHEELQNFVNAGFTPYQALKAATRDAAEFLGRLNAFGTVEKGKTADLVLLDANPLENISNTKAIHAVFINGKYFPKKTLDAMLAELEQNNKLK